MEIIDVYGVLKLLSWIAQQVDARPYPQSLAHISAHWLLDRAVVLNPVHPGRIPDGGEIHGAVPDHQVLTVVQLGPKHEAANPCQRGGAATPLGQGKELRSSVALSDA